MQDKDRLGFKTSATDNQYRFIVIKVHGWFIGPRHNANVWDKPLSMAPTNKAINLMYSMYGNEKVVTLPFPNNKKKRRELQYQIHSLDHIQKDQCYAVWIVNNQPDKQTNNDWYWYDTLNLNDEQAQNLTDYKMSKPIGSRDEDMNRTEIGLIAYHGPTHGRRIYEDIKHKFGTTNPKTHEIMIATNSYWKEQHRIPKMIKKDLDEYFNNLKAKYFMEFDDEG